MGYRHTGSGVFLAGPQDLAPGEFGRVDRFCRIGFAIQPAKARCVLAYKVVAGNRYTARERTIGEHYVAVFVENQDALRKRVKGGLDPSGNNLAWVELSQYPLEEEWEK